MDDYESVALVKQEVFVYRIPPISTNTGHKAADWKLDQPDWTGRLKLVAIGKKLEIRLEDKSTGALYAKCPVDKYPGQAIEAVKDSSRYFVIRLRNDAGQTAFVGCGFADRSDSFDLNVALQDHFKYLEKSAELEDKFNNSGPALDLAFKEGQTISINLKKGPDGQAAPSRSRPTSASSTGAPVPLLPPPPSSGTSVRPRGTTTQSKSGPSNDSLLNF